MWNESGNFMYDSPNGDYRLICTVVPNGASEDAGVPCWEVRNVLGAVVERVLIRPVGVMDSIRDTLMQKYGA